MSFRDWPARGEATPPRTVQALEPTRQDSSNDISRLNKCLRTDSHFDEIDGVPLQRFAYCLPYWYCFRTLGRP